MVVACGMMMQSLRVGALDRVSGGRNISLFRFSRNGSTVVTRQKRVICDTDALKRRADRLLSYVGCQDLALPIILCGPKRISRMNRIYGSVGQTDVISVQWHPNPCPGRRPPGLTDGEELGRVYLGMQIVKDQAMRLGETTDQRATALVAHSLCHCLGMTHGDEQSYRRMRSLEESLLDRLGAAEKDQFKVNYIGDEDDRDNDGGVDDDDLCIAR